MTLMDFFIGITNKCNMSCPWCAHKKLRDISPSYEMSKEEFEKWYNCTKKAGYYFESIDFNGLGEPTLYTDTEFLLYMLKKCRDFTNEVNILTNGTKIDILKKVIALCDNINISEWKKTDNIDELEHLFPHKVHVRRNIVLHDMRYPVHVVGKVDNDIVCGCSGCGYTMETVFLVCGTWNPYIVYNGLSHTKLNDNYLSTLDEHYGSASYPMCSGCWANTSIPYKRMSNYAV